MIHNGIVWKKLNFFYKENEKLVLLEQWFVELNSYYNISAFLHSLNMLNVAYHVVLKSVHNLVVEMIRILNPLDLYLLSITIFAPIVAEYYQP